MLAILNFLNGHNLPIFQPILMIFVSKLMVHRALSDKTYLSLGLLSPLNSLHHYFSVSLRKTLCPHYIVPTLLKKCWLGLKQQLKQWCK